MAGVVAGTLYLYLSFSCICFSIIIIIVVVVVSIPRIRLYPALRSVGGGDNKISEDEEEMANGHGATLLSRL